MSEVIGQSLSSLRALLAEKKISSVELTKQSLSQIEKTNKALNSLVFVDEKAAMSSAEEADKKLMAGEKAALLGIPFSVKDLFNVKGQPTTAGSKILQGYNSPYTATAIQNLLSDGAVLIARNNQDEFGKY
ncbi:MAG: hypothetical protein HRT45_17860 [Bdellovibrionales bacterium]|nr:hypothetical protein [Bdellovibrionales bacterium]